MKSSTEILNIVSRYLPRNNQILIEFIRNMGNILTKLVEVSGNEFKVNKIMSSIKKLVSLYNEEK